MSFRRMVRCHGVVTCLRPHIKPATYEGNSALARCTCSAKFTSLCRNNANHYERRTCQLPAAISVAQWLRFHSFSALVQPIVAFPVRTHSSRSKNYGTQQGTHVDPNLSLPMTDTSSEVNEVIAVVKYKLRHRKVDIEMLSSVVELLLDSGFKKEHITAAMTTNPQVMSQSRHTWQRTIHNLSEYGFNKEQMLPVVLGYPPVLKGKMEGLRTVLETLYSLYVPSGKANELVALSPNILQLKPKVISFRFSRLMEIFRKADVIDLLLLNPSVLVEDWSDIMDRFNYVYFRLGFEQQVMRNSQVLSRSIEHITLRHQFLERSGLFEKPDKHGVTTVDNPKLKQIVDTTDHDFAVNVAGMTLPEFRAFREILKLEAEQEELDARDESDDEDSDDDDSYRL